MPWNGVERRKRSVSRKREIASIIASVCSVVALSVSLFDFESQLNQKSSRVETCRLVKDLVLSATPRNQISAAYAYLTANNLISCQRYATRGPK